MSDTARLFDVGLMSDESRIIGIQSAVQNQAMSMMERQQNMRLKELQEGRSSMEFETKQKINEANLSAAEYDLEMKRQTQDAVLAESQAKMVEATSTIETYKNKKKYEIEAYKNLSKVEDEIAEATKPLLFGEEVESTIDEDLKKTADNLDLLEKKYSILAKSEDPKLAAQYAHLQNKVFVQKEEIQNTLNRRTQQKIADEQAQFVIDQTVNARQQLGGSTDQSFRASFKDGEITSISQGGVGSQASTKTDEQNLVDRIVKNPKASIDYLDDMFEYPKSGGEPTAYTNPELVIRQVGLMQKAGVATGNKIDEIIVKIDDELSLGADNQTVYKDELIGLRSNLQKLKVQGYQEAPARSVVDPSSASISDIVSGNISQTGYTGVTKSTEDLLGLTKALSEPAKTRRRPSRNRNQ